jgi:hypothetical protein
LDQEEYHESRRPENRFLRRLSHAGLGRLNALDTDGIVGNHSRQGQARRSGERSSKIEEADR